jgi:hypothetical protein
VDYLLEELYLLPMICSAHPGNPNIVFVTGLIVVPIDLASYCRTGLFIAPTGDGNVEELLAAQRKATYEDKHFVGEAAGVDEDGQKMCIITLI